MSDKGTSCPPELKPEYRVRSELCKAVVELDTSTRWRYIRPFWEWQPPDEVGDEVGVTGQREAHGAGPAVPSPDPVPEPEEERFVAELFNYGSVLDRSEGLGPAPIPVLALKSKSAGLVDARHSWVVQHRERLQAVDSAIDFKFYADPTRDWIKGLDGELAELADGLRDFLRPQVFEPWKALSPELDAVKGSFEVREAQNIRMLVSGLL